MVFNRPINITFFENVKLASLNVSYPMDGDAYEIFFIHNNKYLPSHICTEFGMSK